MNEREIDQELVERAQAGDKKACGNAEDGAPGHDYPRNQKIDQGGSAQGKEPSLRFRMYRVFHPLAAAGNHPDDRDRP